MTESQQNLVEPKTQKREKITEKTFLQLTQQSTNNNKKTVTNILQISNSYVTEAQSPGIKIVHDHSFTHKRDAVTLLFATTTS